MFSDFVDDTIDVTGRIGRRIGGSVAYTAGGAVTAGGMMALGMSVATVATPILPVAGAFALAGGALCGVTRLLGGIGGGHFGYGATVGGVIGSMFGPFGIAAGAAIGGVVGLVVHKDEESRRGQIRYSQLAREGRFGPVPQLTQTYYDRVREFDGLMGSIYPVSGSYGPRPILPTSPSLIDVCTEASFASTVRSIEARSRFTGIGDPLKTSNWGSRSSLFL